MYIYYTCERTTCCTYNNNITRGRRILLEYVHTQWKDIVIYIYMYIVLLVWYNNEN